MVRCLNHFGVEVFSKIPEAHLALCSVSTGSLLISGLFDHDAQLLILKNVFMPIQEVTSMHVRNVNNYMMNEFLYSLSNENWETVFEGTDTNVIFNNFLNVYLNNFYKSFTKRKCNINHKHNPWITKGIKRSCQTKIILYMRCRDTKDVTLKSQYKRYCKILTDVIKLAKKMHYNEIISKSKNKIKSTWNIIKNELGKGNRHNNIKSLEINNTVTNDPQEIANIFSNYFLSAADTVIKNTKKGNAD